MSAGTRLRLDQAERVAAHLFEAWHLSPRECFVVGSVRRRKPDVGDLELLVPFEPKASDTLCKVIEATMEPASDGLFGVSANKDQYLGRVERGLKPGFLAASLIMRPWGNEIPVQVFRYEPENLGWKMLEYTGPRDFGVWFLGRWKRAWGIPTGQEGRQASVDGHLVDGQGRRVAVPSEADAFRIIQSAFIAPEEREAFAAKAMGGRG